MVELLVTLAILDKPFLQPMDVTYVKVSNKGRVVDLAVLALVAMNGDSRRKILT